MMPPNPAQLRSPPPRNGPAGLWGAKAVSGIHFLFAGAPLEERR